MKILITSGGCKVPIDSVRHIGNFSSGRFGAELLYRFWLREGHDIIFFHERGSSTGSFSGNSFGDESESVTFIEYKDYYDYLKVKDVIQKENPDIIISAAAISDYVVENPFDGKISSSFDELTIKLVKGEKVISSFRELAPEALIVGFKLLVGPTKEEIDHAVTKVFNSGVDLVVYNDLLELKQGIEDRTVFYGLNHNKRNELISAKFDTKTLVEEILVNCALKKVFKV